MTTSQPNPPTPDWNLLGRYLAEEADAAESARVRAWLDEHPREAEAIQKIDAAARRALEAQGADVESALRRVKTRPDTASPWRTRPPARLAAVLAAAAVVFFAFLMWRGPSAAGTARSVFDTQVAMTDTVLLEDGTRILLAPDSRMTVRGHEIDLEGAALLSIADGTTASYVVRAAGAVIRDIGTTFSVRAYRGEPLTVVVSEGIVEIALAATRLTLDSGKVASIGDDGRLVVRQEAASADDLAWSEGRLIFRDASITEVAADLRRWYGVELVVADTSLRERHFTGSFSAESPDRVLEIIALALGARVQRTGDTAIFLRRFGE